MTLEEAKEILKKKSVSTKEELDKFKEAITVVINAGIKPIR